MGKVYQILLMPLTLQMNSCPSFTKSPFDFISTSTSIRRDYPTSMWKLYSTSIWKLYWYAQFSKNFLPFIHKKSFLTLSTHQLVFEDFTLLACEDFTLLVCENFTLPVCEDFTGMHSFQINSCPSYTKSRLDSYQHIY